MKRPYIAGPMTYIAQFNFPAFDAAAGALRALGMDPISPAELDSDEDRAMALASPDGAPTHYTYGKTHADFLARDLKIIADQADAIVVLPGWERSSGARVETFIGFVYGKPILTLDLLHVSPLALYRAWTQEPDLILYRQPYRQGAIA